MTVERPQSAKVRPVAGPGPHRLLADVLHGLSQPAKTLPCKYFYDAAGSDLFERICALPEYYLTRTETRILEDHAGELAAAIGPRARIVEFGSGSSTKTELLLDRLPDAAAYVPIDLAREALHAAAAKLRVRYRGLRVEPIVADYAEDFALPPEPPGTKRTICWFPGSTIGNFTADEAVAFLRRVAAVCGVDGGLLLGADLVKDPAVLLPAYDDAAGVTAEFDKNLLARANAELGADFDLDGFEHRAVWNAFALRIEMQLVSRREQTVRIAGRTFPFREGEILTTEYSHKYTLQGLDELARRGGFAVERTWTDERRWFAVLLLRVA